MDQKVYVYRKVIAGNSLEETLANCKRTYGDALLERVGSQTEDVRLEAERALGIESLLDGVANISLPILFRTNGYRRLDSIFAWPFEFSSRSTYKLYPHISKDGITVIKIEVDSKEVLVLPMAIIDKIYNKDMLLSELLEYARRYWRFAVTLLEFRDSFQQIGHYEWASPDAWTMEKPEVLIPILEQTRMKIVTS